MRRIVPVVILLLVAAACSDGTTDEATTTSAVATTTSTGGEQPATTTAVATTAPPTTVVATPFDATSPLYTDTDRIEVTVTGVNRPHVTWQDADGADRYTLLILAEDGTTVWAWSGTDVAVTVGGGETDRPGLGARVSAPSWVRVIARDTDGSVIAASDPVAIGPAS